MNLGLWRRDKREYQGNPRDFVPAQRFLSGARALGEFPDTHIFA